MKWILASKSWLIDLITVCHLTSLLPLSESGLLVVGSRVTPKLLHISAYVYEEKERREREPLASWHATAWQARELAIEKQ